jgi:membrane-bound ClpP family serine protease
MHSNIILPILLQVIGTAVIISEFFIPSGGFLSIAAAGLFGYSLYLAFTQISAAAGYVFIAIDAVLIPVVVLFGIRIIARGPASLKTTLSSSEGVTSQPEDMQQFMGKSGTTVTALHPSGIALIDGRRIDVVSSGEYIGKLTPVVVTAVTGNQVIVKKT